MSDRDLTGVKKAIQDVITKLMDGVLKKVLATDPFIPERHSAEKPLYAALVPNEIFKGSHFERRFTTPFGSAWEQLAIVVAQHGLGFAEPGRRIVGTIREERLRRIQAVLAELQHGKDSSGRRVKPDWESELAYVMAGGGELLPREVVCDVYAENESGTEKLAFELKAPLPNSDQTKESKEKMFLLYAMEQPQVTAAFFALPYNPYGSRAAYQWSFPKRWFNMQSDPVVLIGDEFWDKIGGEGTYASFISAINELGPVYRERIYREYLHIEPPESETRGGFRVRDDQAGYDSSDSKS